MKEFLEDYRRQTVQAIDGVNLGLVAQAIEWIDAARHEDRQIFVCGNGGSASTASHFMCDMIKGASYGYGKRFRLMALTDNLATITAYSNDVCYDDIFVEQLKNFARPGDVFVAISGSGNSPNVVKAMEWAREAGLKTVAMTGRDGGRLGRAAELNVHVAAPHMGRIEDAHLVVCHMIAYCFMEKLKAAA
ncbi:MAG: SIS domain-containing protein [Bryobacteraceae bacterium]|nr:SIS domain-containing protein [Bryobacteraceae bacterium]